MLPVSATMSNEISSFRKSRNKVNMFNLFRHCLKDEISFDIVPETGNIVAKNGTNVKTTFDTVERIVQLVAFDNVASTLLLVWTGLNVHFHIATYCNYSVQKMMLVLPWRVEG